jgi:D-alanyl-D-alanine endopeptidase (penicillin-binding protein 7)
MKKNLKKILYILFFSLSITFGGFVLADEIKSDPNLYYFLNLDKATIAKGYTVSAFNDDIKLSLVPGILSADTGVDVAQINEAMVTPWNLDKISDVYQFEFRNKSAYDNHRPFYIQFAYATSTPFLKQVYYYDKNYSAWRPLPTTDYPDKKFVRSLIHLPFARLAIFSNPKYLTIGQASWYSHKGGNFAASPDFPKGSRLRVTNVANNKFVDVEVNDFGPDRVAHPNRVLDLDKIAFKKIASASDGVINIKVEPIVIAPDSGGKVLGVSETSEAEPKITAKAFVVYDEKNQKIIWEKNSATVLPLASLTKLVAVYTYLNADTDLSKVIAYSIKDEEYNYQYCKKGESARVKLDDGEEVTVNDMVYSALVGSANNAVETLVRASGLSRETFINNMNNFVKQWGATSTYFEEPTGLSPKNVSSPKDYVIITREVFKNSVIAKASPAASYKFTTINTKEDHRISNTNKLIGLNNGYTILGTKTGYLEEAGYCLMMRAKDEKGNILTAVTFGIDVRNKSFSETDDLLMHGFRILN